MVGRLLKIYQSNLQKRKKMNEKDWIEDSYFSNFFLKNLKKKFRFVNLNFFWGKIIIK